MGYSPWGLKETSLLNNNKDFSSGPVLKLGAGSARSTG